MMEMFLSVVPNCLLWFEQLVPFYLEWVVMLLADCYKFLQVRVLFYFLVVLVDTFYLIFVILDLDLDFGDYVKIFFGCLGYRKLISLSFSVSFVSRFSGFLFLKYSTECIYQNEINLSI